MGKERAIGEIAAGTTGIAGNGEDEENRIWTDAEKKRAAVGRCVCVCVYIIQKYEKWNINCKSYINCILFNFFKFTQVACVFLCFYFIFLIILLPLVSNFNLCLWKFPLLYYSFTY